MLFPSLNRRVERLAAHSHAVKLLFPLAVAEALIFPVPPEVLIAAILAYRKNISWKKLALISALGSLVGATIMYAIGHYGYTSIGVKLVALYHMEDTVAYAGQVFTEHAFAALVLAAFTLLPDRFFALAAGVFSVSLPVFFLGIFTGRVLRAGIFAYLLSRYGERIKDYMFQRLDKVLAFFALVILAILYIAFR